MAGFFLFLDTTNGQLAEWVSGIKTKHCFVPANGQDRKSWTGLLSEDRMGELSNCAHKASCLKLERRRPTASWQSGYAAACKAAYLGSIPGLASILLTYQLDPRGLI